MPVTLRVLSAALVAVLTLPVLSAALVAVLTLPVRLVESADGMASAYFDRQDCTQDALPDDVAIAAAERVSHV